MKTLEFNLTNFEARVFKRYMQEKTPEEVSGVVYQPADPHTQTIIVKTSNPKKFARRMEHVIDAGETTWMEIFDLHEEEFMENKKFNTIRKLLEAEVDQAESIIAARGFSQELQDMLQKLGRLLNEDLPTVAEQMRNTLGPDIATAFEDQTTEVLQTVMDQLRDGKQSIDNSVSEISAGGVPTGSTDMEDPDVNDLDLGDTDDLDLDDLGDLDLDDESEGDDEDLGDDPFAGDDVASGPEDEPLGRPQRESVQQLKKKIAEARRMLERAKRLKEGSNSKQKEQGLWKQITDYEKRAKKTNSPIKKQHYMDMASQLRGKLTTSDDISESRTSKKKVAESASPEDIEKYKNMLHQHDWFYQYSDDYSVWNKGKDSMDALEHARKKYDPDGSIWNSIAPKEYQIKAKNGFRKHLEVSKETRAELEDWLESEGLGHDGWADLRNGRYMLSFTDRTSWNYAVDFVRSDGDSKIYEGHQNRPGSKRSVTGSKRVT